MTETLPLHEALTEANVQELLAKLDALPTPSEYKTTVEAELWQECTPKPYHDEPKIPYNEFAPESRALIGYREIEENDRHQTGIEVPWWLRDFKWEATSIGEETIALNSEQNFNKFENFVIEETTISSPELLHERMGTRSDIYEALTAFKNLLSEFEPQLDFDTQNHPEYQLPNSCFTREDDLVKTTESFHEWFQALLELCPPFTKPLTALTFINSNAQTELAHEFLPDQVYSTITTLGLTRDAEVYNKTLDNALRGLVTLEWSPFDLSVPYPTQSYEHLAPLEAALYETWINTDEAFIKNNQEWFYIQGGRPTTINSESDYARVGLRSPLVKKDGRATLLTLGIISDGSYSTARDQRGKRQEINTMLEEIGVTGDE